MGSVEVGNVNPRWKLEFCGVLSLGETRKFRARGIFPHCLLKLRANLQ